MSKTTLFSSCNHGHSAILPGFTPDPELYQPLRPEIRVQRLRGIPARVADHLRAIDLVIKRFMHMSVDPQDCPIAIHKILQVTGEVRPQDAARKPNASDAHLSVIQDMDVVRSMGLQLW